MTKVILAEFTPSLWLDYLRLDDQALLKYCKRIQVKGSGKGGQKRNKTSNAIQLQLQTIKSQSSKYRSLAENLKSALKKMRLEIASNIEDFSNNRRTLTPPNEIAPYLNHPLLKINESNPIFPFFLAFFLDCFIAEKGEINQISKHLGCTNSQLNKLIRNSKIFSEKTAQMKLKINSSYYRG